MNVSSVLRLEVIGAKFASACLAQTTRGKEFEKFVKMHRTAGAVGWWCCCMASAVSFVVVTGRKHNSINFEQSFERKCPAEEKVVKV
jgi:hypothetical protein